MNEEVSKTLSDLERKLQQLEGELSSLAPAEEDAGGEAVIVWDEHAGAPTDSDTGQVDERSDSAIDWDQAGRPPQSPSASAPRGVIVDPPSAVDRADLDAPAQLDPSTFDPPFAVDRAGFDPPAPVDPVAFDPPATGSGSPIDPPSPFRSPASQEEEEQEQEEEDVAFEPPLSFEVQAPGPAAATPASLALEDLSLATSEQTLSGAAELARARERIEEIARELTGGFDELLRLRERLEQAKGELIDDYKRLLATRDSAAGSPPARQG